MERKVSTCAPSYSHAYAPTHPRTHAPTHPRTYQALTLTLTLTYQADAARESRLHKKGHREALERELHTLRAALGIATAAPPTPPGPHPADPSL
eukprot:scaffold20315_cov56-Phaeocystis_antarctica.AAC.2